MNILRVIPSVNPQAGGPINGLINSSKGLVDKGHNVVVASLDEPESSWVDNFPYELHSFSSSLGVYSYSKPFKQWLYANVNKFDVVVVHGLWQFHSIAVATVCSKLSVPYVVFTHGMLDPWFNEGEFFKTFKKKVYWSLFERKVVNRASSVLFTSEEERDLARASFSPYYPVENLVSYGSPLPNYEVSECKELFFVRYPRLRNKRFVIFLGRIHEKKGVDLLIEAIALIGSLPEDFILVIAGPDGNGLRDRMERRIDQLGLSECVIWTGMLSGELKWGSLYAAEVFILPSHQENFGIVVSEALSTSTPVLISNKVNIWREIEACGAGFVGDDNLSGVVNLLNRWFDLNENDKHEIRNNALQCYVNNFSIEAAVNSLEKNLLSVLAKK